ncbi:MAG: hypothetical protein C6I01_04205 [Epsilonproteobacteria bacterium]|jgi:hypothetical protein|nr:hypothetical protein [Campylobacterota bacterium]NPA89601.1 MFS transporter [Campylobacterota bacterium]
MEKNREEQGQTPQQKVPIEERKLTPGEKAGVTSALLMFFGVGMIMGGSASGKMGIFYGGTAIFTIGAGIALYLLFKYSPKNSDKWEE